MARVFKILIKPSEFFSDGERINDTKTSLVIFGLAMAITSLVSSYYFSEKVIYYLELGELSNIPIQLLGVDYIIMSRLAYLFLASLIILGVGRVFARLVNAERPSIKVHLNVVFSSFLVVLIMGVISTPVILAYPVKQYGIVGASFESVSLFDVDITAEDVETGFKVEAYSTLVIADRMDIKYLNESGYPIEWGRLNSSQIRKTLEIEKPKVYLSNAKVYAYGDRVFNLTVSQLSFEEMKFRRMINLERVLLNRDEITRDAAAVMLDFLGALIPLITWIWLVAVNAAGFRVLFKVSGLKAFAFGLSTFATLVILGIL